MGQIDRYLNKLVNDKKKQIMKPIRQKIKNATNVAVNELYKEAIKMYDHYIDEYYSYHTESYIRHGERRPGTEQGSNLYRGNQIYKKNGWHPLLVIRFSSEDMEDKRYQYDNADTVLDQVVSGVRGVVPYWYKSWEAGYNGKYFSYRGKMIDAFIELDKQANNIAKNIIIDELNKNRG